MRIIYWHSGNYDFPHGAGASDVGYYIYEGTDVEHALASEPDGPEEQEEMAPRISAGEFHFMLIDMPHEKD